MSPGQRPNAKARKDPGKRRTGDFWRESGWGGGGGMHERELYETQCGHHKLQ